MLISSLLAKSVAAKLALGLAALSFGGVAFATETGSLPAPAQDAAHSVLGGIGVPAHHKKTPGRPAERGKGPDVTGPAAVGLCRAYAAGHKDTHGKALDSPPFQALITAAGGKAKVPAYCDKVLAKATNGSHPTGPKTTVPPKVAPSHPAKPSSRAGQPTTQPRGRHGQPTTQPSGGPAPPNHPAVPGGH